MGKIRRAACALAACLVAGTLAMAPQARAQVASDSPVTFAVFEGRDYLLVWPAGLPAGVVIYLHTLEPQALSYEARTGIIEALAADARARGFALLAPTAEQRACDAGAGGAPAVLACWAIESPEEELAYLDRLIASIELQRGARFTFREIVGYGRGADLASAAWLDHRLQGYRKVGLLDLRYPGVPPDAPEDVLEGPLVFVEAPERDPIASRHAGQYLSRLVIAGYGRSMCARSAPIDARYTGERTASFMAWYARDCRVAAAPPPVAAPPTEAEDGRSRNIFGGPSPR